MMVTVMRHTDVVATIITAATTAAVAVGHSHVCNETRFQFSFYSRRVLSSLRMNIISRASAKILSLSAWSYCTPGVTAFYENVYRVVRGPMHCVFL